MRVCVCLARLLSIALFLQGVGVSHSLSTHRHKHRTCSWTWSFLRHHVVCGPLTPENLDPQTDDNSHSDVMSTVSVAMRVFFGAGRQPP